VGSLHVSAHRRRSHGAEMAPLGVIGSGWGSRRWATDIVHGFEEQQSQRHVRDSRSRLLLAQRSVWLAVREGACEGALSAA
jgi:hypothetical protein